MCSRYNENEIFDVLEVTQLLKNVEKLPQFESFKKFIIKTEFDYSLIKDDIEGDEEESDILEAFGRTFYQQLITIISDAKELQQNTSIENVIDEEVNVINSSAEIVPQKVQRLIEMGFGYNASLEALKESNNDISAAVEMLVKNFVNSVEQQHRYVDSRTEYHDNYYYNNQQCTDDTAPMSMERATFLVAGYIERNFDHDEYEIPQVIVELCNKFYFGDITYKQAMNIFLNTYLCAGVYDYKIKKWRTAVYVNHWNNTKRVMVTFVGNVDGVKDADKYSTIKLFPTTRVRIDPVKFQVKERDLLDISNVPRANIKKWVLRNKEGFWKTWLFD
eukprot:244727_1